MRTPEVWHRALLAGDLALELKLASPEVVARALVEFWRAWRESAKPPGFRIDGLTGEDSELLREAFVRVVKAVGGDVRAAIHRRQGLDRSIHVELSSTAIPVLEDLRGEGIRARAPLRPLANQRYVSFSSLGSGGMGAVYLTLDTELNREIAMKVLRPAEWMPAGPDEGPFTLRPPDDDGPDASSYSEMTARLLQEAWITGALEHPGIIPVHEVGSTPAGVPYYTMRIVRGERTLERAIEEASTLEDRLGLLDPYLKVCDAIRYAHSKGVVHRDLKPDNIALGEFGEVIVLDWGMAKVKRFAEAEDVRWGDRIREFRESQDLQTVAAALGTPGYMAPEAALGRVDQVDEKSDVYGLGAILYRILTGRLPFSFKSFMEFVAKTIEAEIPRASEVNPEVPEDLSDICMAALERDRDKRIASADALAATIRDWLHRQAVEREVELLVTEARTTMRDLDGLSGQELLRRLDRARAALSRVREMKPDSDRVRALARRADRLREGAIGTREKLARRSLLKKVAVVGLVAVTLAAGVIAGIVNVQRRDAVDARLRAEEAENESAESLHALLEEKRARDEADRLTEAARTRANDAEGTAAQAEGARQTALESLKEESRARGEAVKKLEEESRQKDNILARLKEEAAAREAALSRVRSLALVHESLLAESKDLVLSLLLAKEACRASPLPRAVSRLRDVLSHFPDSAPIRGHTGKVRAGAISPSGREILTVGEGGSVLVHDPAGTQVASFENQVSAIWFANFSEKGDRILLGCDDGTAVMGRHSGGGTTRLRLSEKTCVAVLLSSTEQHVLTVHKNDWVYLSEANGSEVGRVRCSASVSQAPCFSPSGLLVLTVTRNRRSCQLWNRRLKEVAEFGGHEEAITVARFTTGGKEVLTASVDGTLRFSDFQGKTRVVYRGHTGAVVDIAESANGERIASASRDGTARLWDRAGDVLAICRGPETALVSVGLSSDGRRILTADDATVRVWGDDGQELATYPLPEKRVRLARISPDGKSVLVVGMDGAAVIWRPGAGPGSTGASLTDLLDRATQVAARDFRSEERIRFKGLLEGRER